MISIKKIAKIIPGCQACYRFTKNRIIEINALAHFLEERSIIRADGPIRVGFICQYLPAWTKIQDIYIKMLEDLRFEPYLLCVPTGISNYELENPRSVDNDAYTYCINNGFPEAINTLIEENTWLDLKTLELEYIFYSRPYDSLLPRCYGSSSVSRYSKICHISYGITLTKEGHALLGKDFMSNCYLYFAEFNEVKDYNIQQNRLLHWMKLQKTECHGYPMLDHLLKYKDATSAAWKFSLHDFRILWTPRWVIEPPFGGSNFQRYYPLLLEFAKNHPDIDILHRPHPFTFKHFVETGRMTAEEVEAYKIDCCKLPNSNLDELPEYEATLWNTSVFVTDITSMLVEFLIIGKPVLYCKPDIEFNNEAYFDRMLEGCYIVNNEQELVKRIEDLKKGIDPLCEIRKAVQTELIKMWNTNDYLNILDALACAER